MKLNSDLRLVSSMFSLYEFDRLSSNNEFCLSVLNSH